MLVKELIEKQVEFPRVVYVNKNKYNENNECLLDWKQYLENQSGKNRLLVEHGDKEIKFFDYFIVNDEIVLWIDVF